LRTFDADRISLYVQTKTMVEDPLECHVTVIFIVEIQLNTGIDARL